MRDRVFLMRQIIVDRDQNAATIDKTTVHDRLVDRDLRFRHICSLVS